MITQRPTSPISPNLPKVDRRTLIGAAMFGTAFAAVPLAAQQSAGGFTHSVASGEPGANSVLLWTRYVHGADAATLTFEVAEDIEFSRVVSGGTAEASRTRDFCAKATAEGLSPDRWYYYRFVAESGAVSPTGRTRTLPEGPSARFRLAVVGCSNIGFGWFNAYAHIAQADDVDLIVHTGDYLYEYGTGVYPSAKQELAGRETAPQTEIVALADYRTRYASYRADTDLQRLHQLFPMIAVPDDHESANDSYVDGAENHQPASEGSWGVRKAAAMQAYREWLPISDEPWAAYDIGDLATLFRLETRVTARSKPFDLGAVIKRGDGDPARIQAAFEAFRDDEWRDPSRTLMGTAQEAWLAEGMKRSRNSGKVWQVLAQQVLMTSLSTSDAVLDGVNAQFPAYIRTLLENSVAASKAGLPFNMDAWDGYPAARERLLGSAQEAEANLIVLAGDSHNAWASDLTNMGAGAGVEFAGHSVSSPGFENTLPWIKAQDLAADSVARNAQLKWAETSQRGYMAVELTPTRATSEYRFLNSIKVRSATLASAKRISTEAGSQKLDIG
ncbi:alkaline phosphatase D family protein [Altererythrobacter sp. ZODW24]|uniref:alkaline phosphatase D family protein n=1 Tax=Altererythrobacter sp. ZODW24 TaxID=2185142 RepID=UPI000DF7F60D|nr:alkaline phosphatase D family protein [Altererythrobacter sp. ZODW24]